MPAMRWLVVVCAVACSSKSEPRVGGSGSGSGSPAPASAPGSGSDLRALPAALPPGPYVVRYHCFHSERPTGTGSTTVERTVDLAAQTLTSVDIMLSDDREPHPPTAPAVIKLDTATASQLRAAVDRVVHGGPYRAEPADPEGTACALAIGTSPTSAFFEIDKSSINQRDAISDLVELIHKTANR